MSHERPTARTVRTACAWLATSAMLVVALSMPGCSREPVVRDAPPLVLVEATSDGVAPVQRGHGFVIEQDGFVLTAYDILTDPATGRLLPEIRISLLERPDQGPLPATVIGVEPTLNFAVLKVDVDDPLRVAAVDRQREAEVGRQIFAATHLDPADPSEMRLTQGRLAGLNQKECYQESLTATMFRAEIELPRSVAGTPVFDMDGTVVALFTAYVEPDLADPDHEHPGETHVLPIFLATNIYNSLKRKGSFESPWTGFSVRALDESERALFPDEREHLGGIAVEYVWEGSPAARLGVREGDILLKIGSIRIHSVADFQKWLYLYGVGHEVGLTFLRGGDEYLTADYVIEKRPDWAKPR